MHWFEKIVHGDRQNKAPIGDTGLAVCGRYSTVWWNNLPGFRKAHDELKSMVDMINELNTSLQHSTKVSTENKKRVKEEMINQTMIVVGAAKAYAASTGNKKLKGEFNLPVSKITNVREMDADDICLNKIRKAQEILQHLSAYGITQMEMDIAIAAVTNYTGLIGEARATRNEMLGTNAQMKDLFQQVESKLKDELDGLMARFKTSHPSFYREYFAARKSGRPQRAKKTEATSTSLPEKK